MSDADYKKFRSSKGTKEMREFDKRVSEAEKAGSRVIGRGGTQAEARKAYDKVINKGKKNTDKKASKTRGKATKSKSPNPKMGKSSGSFKIEGGQKRKFK